MLLLAHGTSRLIYRIPYDGTTLVGGRTRSLNGIGTVILPQMFFLDGAVFFLKTKILDVWRTFKYGERDTYKSILLKVQGDAYMGCLLPNDGRFFFLKYF
jgi:hypothetical protein